MHRLGHVIGEVCILFGIGHQYRVSVTSRRYPVGAVDGGAHCGNHRAEERRDRLHPCHRVCIASIDRRPVYAAWTRRRFVSATGVGGSKGRIGTAVDHAFPAVAEAAEFHTLHVIPAQPAICQVCRVVDVQSRCALDPAHAQTFHVGIGKAFAVRLANLFAGLYGDGQRQTDGAAIVGCQNTHRLWAPVFSAELEHAFLCHERPANTVGRKLHLALTQRFGAGDIVFARQNPQVHTHRFLQRRADGHGLVIPGRAGAIGGPSQTIRQIDLLSRQRSCRCNKGCGCNQFLHGSPPI